MRAGKKGFKPLKFEGTNKWRGRVFRKTAEQLAVEYQPRLAKINITLSINEIISIIKGGTSEPSIATTIIQRWLDEEHKRGVTII
jgi:hypothetical protein